MIIDNELKQQFSELMHEIIRKNKEIVNEGDYSNLLSLCEQDITILAMISKRNDITAKEISKQLETPKSTIVTAVSRLVKRGYIERIQNENDKREMLLKLTDKGIKANCEHIEYEDIFLESLVSRWSETDQNKLAELLKKRRSIS